MTDCRGLSFSANRLVLNGKQVIPLLGREDVIKKDLKEMTTSWEGLKRKALKKIGMEEERA